MGEDVDDDDDDDEIEEEPGGKKKLLIVITLLILVLFLGGGAVLYFTGLLDPLLGIEEEAGGNSPALDEAGQEAVDYASMVDEDGNPLGPALVDLPEFLINWEADGKRIASLKLVVALEVANPADAVTVMAAKDQLYEELTKWLREQNPQDLEGAQGIFRLREAFFIRCSNTLQGIPLRDVVMRTILLQ